MTPFKTIRRQQIQSAFSKIKSPVNEDNVITGSCIQTCEFAYPQMDQIHYRILPGKHLQRSLDNGISWQEELEVPDWNQMGKNYVNLKFSEMGSTPRDMRGPFSAVSDPNRGNLIVAMGIEGVLVRSKDNQWTWVSLGGFKQINPSRSDMLKLIPNQEWLKVY